MSMSRMHIPVMTVMYPFQAMPQLLKIKPKKNICLRRLPKHGFQVV